MKYPSRAFVAALVHVITRSRTYCSDSATFPLPSSRPRNDLYCVGWDVKPYLLTHSLYHPVP